MRYRLRIAATICLMASSFSGCVKYRPVAAKPPQARPAESSLSEYVQTVLRLSTEDAKTDDEALAKLHKEKPEIAALAQRVSESPQDLAATRSLARAYLDEGFPLSAFQLYQQLQLRAPGDPDAHIGLALIWDRWKEYDLALECATRAVSLGPDYVPALETMGRVYLHRNELDNALASFLAGVQAAPNNAALLANTGYVYILRQDWGNARGFLERAVALDGSVAETRNNLGIVLAISGDREGALRQFLAVHDTAAAHNNLGATYLGIGNFRFAQEEFRLALAIRPDYEKAAMNLREAEAHMPPGNDPSVPERTSTGSLETAPLEYRPISPLSLTDYMRQLFRMQADAAAEAALAPYRPASIAEDFLARGDDIAMIADFSQFRQISAKGLEAAEDLAAIVPPVTEEAGAALPAAPPATADAMAKPAQVPAVVVMVPWLPPETLATAPKAMTTPPAHSSYSVQVFAAKDERAVQAENEALSKQARVDSAIERADLKDKGIWYRARIRGYETFSAALAAAKDLVLAGIIKGYWIVPPNN